MVNEELDIVVDINSVVLEIVKQEMKPGFVLTTFENGMTIEMPYKIDEEGEEYTDAIPDGIRYLLN